MGMLDNAFKKTPDKKISPTRKRMQSKAVVPYGTGRHGTTKTPMITPPPRQSTSLTVYKPKPIAIRQPKRGNGGSKSQQRQQAASRPSSVFDFGEPSKPLGSSSGISAGKRHKGKVVGGIGAKLPPKHGRGEQDTGISLSLTKRNIGKVGRGVKKGAMAITGFGDTKAQKQKTRKSIGKQIKKRGHSLLFGGKGRRGLF